MSTESPYVPPGQTPGQSQEIDASGDVIFRSDTDATGSGDLIFKSSGVERVRIKYDGTFVYNPDASSHPAAAFLFSARTTIAGVAVPELVAATTNTRTALDLWPNGTPGDFSANTGTAWIDVCSTDFNDQMNFESISLGKFSASNGNRGYLSTGAGGTGQIQNLMIQHRGGKTAFGANVAPTGIIDISDGTVHNLASVASSRGIFGTNSNHAIDLYSNSIKQISIEANGDIKIGSASTVNLGFYGSTGTTRQILATGTAKTVDNVITVLQNLGLVSQS